MDFIILKYQKIFIIIILGYTLLFDHIHWVQNLIYQPYNEIAS